MKEILVNFDAFSSSLLDYAILLTATGVLSMALVEAVKGLVSAKVIFHRDVVKRWLGNQFGSIDEASQIALIPLQEKLLKTELDMNQFKYLLNNPECDTCECKNRSLNHVMERLEEFCSGVKHDSNDTRNFFKTRDSYAFYALDTEQLTAKLQKTLELVLQNPEKEPYLFLILASYHADSAAEWLSTWIILELAKPPSLRMRGMKPFNTMLICWKC